MLRCTKAKHTNCMHMLNATMKSSKKILQAYVSDIEFEGTRYCVTGKALVQENEVEDFVNGLWKIKSRSVNPTGIKNLEVLVSQ